ncbi:hypothetical protein RQP46_009375 [Phenoliferia psychrophenolica]
MNTGTRDVRLIKQDLEVVAALVKEVRSGLLPTQDSIAKLQKLACYKTLMRRWKGEEAQFVTHARKYLQALRPDSGIAFHETDRYAKLPKSATLRQTPSPTPPPPSPGTSKDKASSTFIEVAVFATRSFKKGDTINLKGGVANLTEEEDDALRASGGKQDFSVLHSARKGCFSLLLGPARFVNHDCWNNVEFRLTGNHMAFKVVEDIEADEQLFTDYGASFRLSYKRGAFSVATKPVKLAPAPVPARKRVAASPARRSSRTSAPPGLGHELTAQRSYADDYEWNGRKKTAVYKGIIALPLSVRSTKRKRDDDSGTDFGQGGRDGLSSSASRVRGGPLDPFGDGGNANRRRVSSKQKPKKAVNLGGRTSSRNPAAVFSRLDALVGLGESDSELSELDADDGNANSDSSLSELTPSDSEGSADEMEVDPEPAEEDLEVVPSSPGEEEADAKVSQHAAPLAVRGDPLDAGDGDSDLTSSPSSSDDEDADARSNTSRRRRPVRKLEDALADPDGQNADDEDDEGDDEDDLKPFPPNPTAPMHQRSPSLDFDIAPRTLAAKAVPEAALVFAVPQPPDTTLPNEAAAEPPLPLLLASPIDPVTPADPATPAATPPIPGPSSAPPNVPQADASEFDPLEGDISNESDIVLVTVVPLSSSNPPPEPSPELQDAPADGPNGNGETSNTPPDASPNDRPSEDREGGEQGAGADGDPPVPPSAGGGGGDDRGDDGKDGRKPNAIGEPEVVEAQVEVPSEEEEAVAAEGEAGARPADEPVGERDEDAAAQALLSMFMLPPSASLASGPLGYGPPPDPLAPSPPKTSSASDSSAGSSRALEQALVLKPPRRATPRTSDANDVKPEVKRSTRRHSLLSPSPPPPLARASSFQPAKKAKPDSGPSHPIPGDLKDLLSGPLVTGVAGGYDPETKRYFTTAAGKRPARSPSPPEQQETASPEPERATRRSRPIDGDIRDLLASPRVAAVSGGFDPQTKRYVSKKQAEREYRETGAIEAE